MPLILLGEDCALIPSCLCFVECLVAPVSPIHMFGELKACNVGLIWLVSFGSSSFSMSSSSSLLLLRICVFILVSLLHAFGFDISLCKRCFFLAVGILLATFFPTFYSHCLHISSTMCFDVHVTPSVFLHICVTVITVPYSLPPRRIVELLSCYQWLECLISLCTMQSPW